VKRNDHADAASTSARDFLPERRTLPSLARAAAGCRGCPLFANATQTVFGEGRLGARLMLVGEVPGDREDRAGRPFVGPAGALLDRALDDAGIARADAYVTNVVKHFKWEARGKRRLHRTPNRREVAACLPWLEAEIELIAPRVLVCLGATAGKALFGPSFLITRSRGRPIPSNWAPYVTATVHPSAVLRVREEQERRRALADFVRDLASAAKHLES
jgi:DNA polymerase